MSFLDKRNIFHNLDNLLSIDLELGCGGKKRNPQAIGIDLLDFAEVDIVGDIYEVLKKFPTSSVTSVYSSHFVEHIQDVPELLSILDRIVKPGGVVEFIAPHFSNPYFYSDPTHRNFFGLYTFCYYANSSLFSRQVPTYGYVSNFNLKEVDLVFKSPRPFFIRGLIKASIGLLFNSCNYLKEFYEENLCYVFACYEVGYKLQRKDTFQ